ncbi:substrate-binding domain-containing protein [Desulfonatronovibrio magnus]|uniref:substrate-binding domain-containing protein n=1 Tax=Desulfonatronovibrio magnus TaxID=698827 RepID=UPI0012F798F0|nr:substrate-binding domain-containing protein [Desulfonatronovibrio magnus]
MSVKIMMLIVMSLMFFSGCSEDSSRYAEEKPRLLVYTGVTMVNPMVELAAIVESKCACRITILQDASSNHFNAIKALQQGDLFLPGDESFIEQAAEKGFISQTVLVGFNRAAIMVNRGNPLGLKGDPAELLNPEYAVVLADPELGSIGRETTAVFARKGLAEEILDNIMYYAADSKGVTMAIVRGQAHAGINWYAPSVWDENKEHVQALLMDEKYAPPRALILAKLSFSKHAEEALVFMEIASGPIGKAIFRKHGFILEEDSL